MKKKYRIVLMVIVCLLTGCRDMRENEAGVTLQEASEYTAGMQTLAVQKETVRPETEVMEENIDKTRKGSGSITYEKNVEHLFLDSLKAEASEGGARFR